MLFSLNSDPALDVGVAFDRGPRGTMEDAAVISGRRVAVFDGLGGMGGGDRAAQAAAKTFSQSNAQGLEASIQEAHEAVLKAQDWNQCMTTIAAVEITNQPYRSWSAKNGLGRKPQLEPRLVKIAWSGDCRVSILRNGEHLEQITEDHGVDEIVTRCLGSRSQWFPEVTETRLGPTDVLLISSDGLHDVAPTQYIADQIRCGGPMDEIAHRLVQLALNMGTGDNVTALVVRLRG